jgi:hypothetical protein
MGTEQHNACVHRAAVNDIDFRSDAARRSAWNTLLCRFIDVWKKTKRFRLETKLIDASIRGTTMPCGNQFTPRTSENQHPTHSIRHIGSIDD